MFWRKHAAILLTSLLALTAPVAGQTVLLDEDFDGTTFPPAGWHVKNLGSNTGGATWARSTSAPHGGTGKANSQAGASGEAMEEWLVTPALAVPDSTNAVFSLWHRLNNAYKSDGPEYICVSVTDTAVASFVDTIFVDAQNMPVFWTPVAVDLFSRYAGQTIHLAFIHLSSAGNADAWNLDDVLLSYRNSASHDIGVSSAMLPAAQCWRDSSYAPAAVIGNYGLAAEAGYDVSCIIRDSAGTAVYTGSRAVSDTLAVGAADTVSFPDWTPGIEGVYTVTFITSLTGDGYAVNDTAAYPTTSYYHRSTGGPDAFGYRWSDSDTANGPSYEWIDATAGTALGTGDDAQIKLQIGFPFPFYGTTYDSLWISTNGYVNFTKTGGTSPFDTVLPCAATPNNGIYLFWDDLNVASGEGNIYYTLQGGAPDRRAVIEWNNVRRYNITGNGLTFQLVLGEDGTIRMQYRDAVAGCAAYDGGGDAATGIENAAGTAGLQYCRRGDPPGNRLHDSLAIVFAVWSDTMAPLYAHTARTNTFETAPVLCAAISDASPLASDTLYFSTGSGYSGISHDSIAGTVYWYTIPAHAPGTAIQYFFASSDSAHNRGRYPGQDSSLGFKILPDTNVHALLVSDFQQDYANIERPVWYWTLDTLGYQYDVYNLRDGAASLRSYQTVFLSMRALDGSVPACVQMAESLMAYLADGTVSAPKKLIVFSKDFAYDTYAMPDGEPRYELRRAYMHAGAFAGGGDGLDNNATTWVNSRMQHMPGEPISDGNDWYVYSNSPDVTCPDQRFDDTVASDTSHIVCQFWPGTYAESWFCAMKYANPGYRTFFCTFDLSNLNTGDQTVQFVNNIVTWMDTCNPWGAPLGIAGSPPGDRSRHRTMLYPNAPNPFSSATAITYSAGRRGEYDVSVYNLAGQLVRQVFRGVVEPGFHTVRWDGRNSADDPVAAGVYFIRLRGADDEAMRKICLVR